MIVLGIDPGLDGALAILSEGKVISVFDTPTFEITMANKKKRRVVDMHGLARWVELQIGVTLAVVEDVHSRPDDGAVQAFKFGRCFGNAEQAVACNYIPIQYVHPATWKRALGLEGQDKDASRRRASELYPAFARLWPLKKHDGRAEAVLLAHYGSKYGR